MVAPDVMIGASFLILFTTVKYQLGFLSVLASHVAFSIPIVVLMVLPRLKEMNRDMVNAAYDLGATQVQMLKEIMFAVSDTSHYCWLLYGLLPIRLTTLP